jgi:hypothetical protein
MHVGLFNPVMSEAFIAAPLVASYAPTVPFSLLTT